MSKIARRFRDTGETIYDMMDEILVVCAECSSCARITLMPSDEQPQPMLPFRSRRLICPQCGLIKRWQGNGLGLDPNASPMRDSYFGLPLWLQTTCCGHTLWAYNVRHLHLMEQYIQADLREHRPDPRSGWNNNSLVNRLPEWMIVAKHRDALLLAIYKLKQERALAI